MVITIEAIRDVNQSRFSLKPSHIVNNAVEIVERTTEATLVPIRMETRDCSKCLLTHKTSFAFLLPSSALVSKRYLFKLEKAVSEAAKKLEVIIRSMIIPIYKGQLSGFN